MIILMLMMIIYPSKEEMRFQKKMILFLKQKKNLMDKIQDLVIKDGTLILKINILLRKDVETEVVVQQEEDGIGRGRGQNLSCGGAAAQRVIPTEMHGRHSKVTVT